MPILAIDTNIWKTIAYKLKIQDVMTKIEQLRYIDEYIDDNLSENELRELIYELINNDSLRRSFKMFSQVN